MKKPAILSAILLSGLIYTNAKAQFSIHVGFNIPARQVYVPAPPPVEPVYNDEFDDSDDYYYLPEVEAYYSIPGHCYFYNDGSRWVSAAYLPGAYRNYDWRNARRFEIKGRRPYINHDVYRGRWGGNPNRGDWNRDNNGYAGRGFDNRGSRDNQSRNYGYNQPNRNDNRGRGNWGGRENQPQQPNRNDDRGHGNWGDRENQPQQPNRNDDRGRGNWGGQQQNGNRDKGNWGGGQNQPQRPAQPSRNDNGDRGSRGGDWRQGQPAQPSNNSGGRDRGNNSGGSQFAQNQTPGRMGMARPRF